MYRVYTDSESIRRACTLEITMMTSRITVGRMRIALVVVVVEELARVARAAVVLGDDLSLKLKDTQIWCLFTSAVYYFIMPSKSANCVDPK